jgi:hypothetical protein
VVIASLYKGSLARAQHLLSYCHKNKLLFFRSCSNFPVPRGQGPAKGNSINCLRFRSWKPTGLQSLTARRLANPRIFPRSLITARGVSDNLVGIAVEFQTLTQGQAFDGIRSHRWIDVTRSIVKIDRRNQQLMEDWCGDLYNQNTNGIRLLLRTPQLEIRKCATRHL